MKRRWSELGWFSAKKTVKYLNSFYIDYMLKRYYFECIELNKMLKLISTIVFFVVSENFKWYMCGSHCISVGQRYSIQSELPMTRCIWAPSGFRWSGDGSSGDWVRWSVSFVSLWFYVSSLFSLSLPMPPLCFYRSVIPQTRLLISHLEWPLYYFFCQNPTELEKHHTCLLILEAFPVPPQLESKLWMPPALLTYQPLSTFCSLAIC